MPPNHNFVVITPMIMKSGTGMKLDVFYTMITKYFMTSLPLRNYEVKTRIFFSAEFWYSEVFWVLTSDISQTFLNTSKISLQGNIWNDNFRKLKCSLTNRCYETL